MMQIFELSDVLMTWEGPRDILDTQRFQMQAPAERNI